MKTIYVHMPEAMHVASVTTNDHVYINLDYCDNENELFEAKEAAV